MPLRLKEVGLKNGCAPTRKAFLVVDIAVCNKSLIVQTMGYLARLLTSQDAALILRALCVSKISEVSPMGMVSIPLVSKDHRGYSASI